MATFCLMTEIVLRFSSHIIIGQYGQRQAENSATLKFPPNFPVELCPTLIPLVEEENADQRNGDVQVEICIRNELVSNLPALIRLKAGPENPVLKHIWATFPQGNVSLSVSVAGFGEVRDLEENAPEVDSENWINEGIKIEQTSSLRLNENGKFTCPRNFTCHGSMEIESAGVMNAWKNEKMFEGTFSVFLIILKSPHDLQQHKHLLNMKDALEHGIETDLELLAKGNGARIRCHRVMLAVSSPILQNFLRSRHNMSFVRFMNHLSEECIKAFLAFIYYGGITKVFSSTEMAVQVLQAALDFQVVSLVSRIRGYFDLKENNHISAEHAVRLFIMVKSYSSQQLTVPFGYDDVRADSRDGDDMSGGDPETEDDHNDDPVSIAGESYTGRNSGSGIRGESDDDNDEGERRHRKRMCYRGAVARFGGQGPSSSNRVGAYGSDDNSSDMEIHTTSNLNQAEKSILEGLENRIVRLIEWYVRNRGNAIKTSVAYKELESRKRLMEITNISLELLAQQPDLE